MKKSIEILFCIALAGTVSLVAGEVAPDNQEPKMTQTECREYTAELLQAYAELVKNHVELVAEYVKLAQIYAELLETQANMRNHIKSLSEN